MIYCEDKLICIIYEKVEKSKNNNERASKQRARARKREGKERKRDILENKHTRLNYFLINNTQIRNTSILEIRDDSRQFFYLLEFGTIRLLPLAELPRLSPGLPPGSNAFLENFTFPFMSFSTTCTSIFSPIVNTPSATSVRV